MSALELSILCGLGFAAGWINTLAGGGSMLTVPALMFLGLPADVANGTSRVAVVAQCITGMRAYHRAGRFDTRQLLPIVLPTLVGSAAGAYLATWLPNHIFEPVLLITMLAMALLLSLRPAALTTRENETPRSPTGHPLARLSLVGAGFYGGFLQAGVGILLLTVLVGMLRHDLLRANALKLAVVLAFSLVSVAIFIVRERVQWTPALVLAAGNSLGAQWGVRFAVSHGQNAVRKLVTAMVVLSCLVLLLR